MQVTLPVAGAATAEASKEPEPKREMLIRGRVLLVEDEEAVLDFERDVLVGAGAEVATLRKSAEVKEGVLRDTYDALITSGTPAGSTAVEIHQWLGDNCPGLEKHVLFTFATDIDSETSAYLQSNNIPFLIKPFEVVDLIMASKKLLQGTHAAAAAGK